MNGQPDSSPSTSRLASAAPRSQSKDAPAVMLTRVELASIENALRLLQEAGAETERFRACLALLMGHVDYLHDLLARHPEENGAVQVKAAVLAERIRELLHDDGR